MPDNPANQTCPHCGRLTPPGRFCERCGKKLDAPPAAPSAPDSAAGARRASLAPQGDPSFVGQPVDAASALTASQPAIPSPLAARPYAADAAESRPTAQAPQLGHPPPPVAPAIPHPGPVASFHPIPQAPVTSHPSPVPIAVDYNFVRAFVVGHTYAFQFRIRCTGGPIRALRITVGGETGGNALPAPYTVPYQIDRDPVPVQISFTPTVEAFGEPAFTITFQCQCAHSQEWQSFLTTVNHRIYPANVKSTEAARSLMLNITNNIENHGHAVDIKTQSLLDDLVTRFADDAGNPTQAMHALIDRIAGTPIFSPLLLLPANHQGRTRLTLVRGDTAVHLVDGASVSFGRNSRNDITLRAFTAAGAQDDKTSALLSRHHFRIDFDGHRCIFRDGGRDPRDAAAPVEKSAFGTDLNGAIVPPKGAVPLPSAAPSVLALAVKGRPGGILSLTAAPGGCLCADSGHPCPAGNPCAAGVTASIALRRGDGVHESYVLVWRCAALAPFFPDLGDTAVYRRHGCFVLCRDGGPPQPLVPGATIPSRGGAIAVQDFRQIGL